MPLRGQRWDTDTPWSSTGALKTMSLIEVVRIQQQQDLERLEVEHQVQEAQARVQGWKDALKTYTQEGQVLAQELAEKGKLLVERQAYCNRLVQKNHDAERNIIGLDNVLKLSNGNLETRLREEKLKQEQREAEVETARQTFSAKAKDMVSAAGIDPSLESALVERDAEFGFVRLAFTMDTVETTRTEVEELKHEVDRLKNEITEQEKLSEISSRSSKRQRLSRSVEELDQLVQDTEEEVRGLRDAFEEKVQERQRLQQELNGPDAQVDQ